MSLLPSTPAVPAEGMGASSARGVGEELFLDSLMRMASSWTSRTEARADVSDCGDERAKERKGRLTLL